MAGTTTLAFLDHKRVATRRAAKELLRALGAPEGPTTDDAADRIAAILVEALRDA